MNPIALPLHDSSQWPLRMTKSETAHVLRCCVRTFDRLAKQGLVPAPDGSGFFLRTEIEAYLRGNVRTFDKQRRRAS